MKKQKNIKDQLKPLYENMRFLNLIFEKKEAPYIKSLIQNRVEPSLIKKEIINRGGNTDQIKKLSEWMNWLNEGEYKNVDDPYYSDYGHDPEIDISGEEEEDTLNDDIPATQSEDENSYEFPMYVLVWQNTPDGKKPKILKANDYSELIDYTTFQNQIEQPIKDFEQAKRNFLSLGGDENELKNLA